MPRPGRLSTGNSFRFDESGIAAVEFALILPVMLVLYMGLVELSRGMRAAQRLDLVAHTLADLTAQTLQCPSPTPAGCQTGQAGLNEADITSIFAAANTLMAPLPTSTLKMTISEVEIVGSPTAAPTSWTANVRWSVTRNSATRRTCGPLTPQDAKPVSLGTIPTSYTQTTADGVKPTTGYIIVADVIYPYSPGVSYELFKWRSNPPTWNMQRTSYAPVRNTYPNSHILYYMTSGQNCGGSP